MYVDPFDWYFEFTRVFIGFRHSRQTRKHKSCILCPIFGQSRFPGNSKIPDPVNIFIVFPIPAPYFGQIPNPENTLPDPHISLFNLRYGKLAIVSLFYYISKAKNQPCRRTYSSVKQINKNSDYFRFNLQLTIRNNLKFKVASSSPCMRNDQRGPHLQNFSKTFSISTPKESLATNRN